MNTRIFKEYGLILLLLVISCGEWGWEKVQSEYESELNVFGLISSDSSYLSFVSVQRTLELNERDYYFAEDTLWFGPGQYDYYTENREKDNFAVEDAHVAIYDGEKSYRLHYVTGEQLFRLRSWEYDIIARLLFETWRGLYIDTTFQFYPKPNEQYTVEVISKDGKMVTGVVTTPSKPIILEDQTPDTVSILSGYNISWESDAGTSTLLKAHQKDDSGYSWLSNNRYAKPEYKSLFLHVESWQRENIINSNFLPDSIRINILSFDPYYDEYVSSVDDEFLSMFLGIGGENLSVNVEGGRGLITSLSASSIERVIIK